MKKITIVLLALSMCFVVIAQQKSQQKKPPQGQGQVLPKGSAPGEIVMASNYTNSTSTPTDTPLSFTVPGNSTWTMTCALYFSGTSKVMQIDLTGPNAIPVTLGYSFDHALAGPLGGTQNNVASAWGTQLGLPNNAPIPNQKMSSTLTMGVTTGTQAGSITVQASAPSGTITIYSGSWCRIE